MFRWPAAKSLRCNRSTWTFVCRTGNQGRTTQKRKCLGHLFVCRIPSFAWLLKAPPVCFRDTSLQGPKKVARPQGWPSRAPTAHLNHTFHPNPLKHPQKKTPQHLSNQPQTPTQSCPPQKPPSPPKPHLRIPSCWAPPRGASWARSSTSVSRDLFAAARRTSKAPATPRLERWSRPKPLAWVNARETNKNKQRDIC